MRRRELLSAWRLLAAALAAAAALPPLAYWWRSSRRESAEGSWADLGPARALPEGSWQPRQIQIERRNRWRVDRESHTVFVRRRSGKLEALSAVCPHSGCLVRAADAGFACPCHQGLFDDAGRPLQGPPPRPLDRLEVEQARGRLRVRWHRFRPGLSHQEALRG